MGGTSRGGGRGEGGTSSSNKYEEGRNRSHWDGGRLGREHTGRGERE